MHLEYASTAWKGVAPRIFYYNFFSIEETIQGFFYLNYIKLNV